MKYFFQIQFCNSYCDTIPDYIILHLLIHNQQVEGAVLVFLPGYEDFSIVKDLIGSQSLLSRDITEEHQGA